MSVLRHRPLGERIPNLPHAVSCSLPTLADVIGYEERKPSVVDRMTSGYPRFVKHPYLRQVAAHVLAELGIEDALFWPCCSAAVATSLLQWMQPRPCRVVSHGGIQGVLVPNSDEAFRHAKTFLQHTGGFLSSREAEDFLVREGVFACVQPEPSLPPATSTDLRAVLSRHSGAAPSDLFLANSGMNAVYSAFRVLDTAQRKRGRTVWIQLGWLYLDTIAILQKFCATPADYLHHGDVFDVAGLQALFRAHAGRIAGVITEVPTNPLVQTCDLPAVAELCRREGAALIADPSINCMANVDVLPQCDALVTSLTKYYAADGDVIAGLVAVNAASPFAEALRSGLPAVVEPPYARDEARLASESLQADAVVARINASLPAVVDLLQGHPAVEGVFWALHPYSKDNYTRLARTPGSVGSLVTFNLRRPLAEVYDRLRVAKGPSFGMHTSLASPFMYLAHYELVTTEHGRAHLRSHGIDPHLIRLSIGTEPVADLLEALREALD
ncbi:PLP-dependent transferase [Nibricoccus sp. IMCC34717]|uniref:PLP-dependent transferase n=1 Tax=Nibricoccus sp. IMCC34717 TaxID=3034021 RepID=UPI00384E9FBD